MAKMSKKKKKIIVSIILVVLVTVICSLLIYSNINKGVIDTDGIKVYYRVYTKNSGWSRWYQNGQIAGNPNEAILAVEAKVKSDKVGNILYNIYSSNNTFDDNDSYNGETAGDKERPIYGIKFFITDDLFKDYQIYYRTHNKKDGWLEWTSKYNISGDNEVDIDQVQIKVLKIDDYFNQNIEKASIGF